jgi:putative membrane protein
MHLGRKYKFTQFLRWTGWEAGCLLIWALLVTLFLQLTQWNFLTIPAPILTIVGSALAIILAFKNQQCYARFNEALVFAGQVSGSSLTFANRLKSTIGNPDGGRSGALLKEFFYRHLALLTVLRFSLRERKPWENQSEWGNAWYLSRLPTPESQSSLKDELKAYLPDADVEKILTHPADKETLILGWQYDAITDLYNKKLISELFLTVLSAALDDVARALGAVKRIKNYPYARNFYSIAVFLVTIYAAIVPFGLFPYAQELGRSAGIGQWTVWLNVPFSAVVGWIFLSLEKVGENSSNPFEGGPNDVPISSITRRVEIEMRLMLGEQTALKPIETKNDILF